MNTAVLVNGEARDAVSSADRGFQYGDGLFETIAVRDGRPLRFARHLARLRRGAERLGIVPPSAAMLEEEARQLCKGTPRAVLKIIVTRGPGGRGYACDATAAPTRVLRLQPWRERSDDYARHGVAVRLCHARLGRNPLLAGIKHLNRLEHVLARREWSDEFAEGLMRDDTGDVIEGTMSNVFTVAAGALHTPDLSACGVEGVMRAVVLEAAAQLGLETRIGRITTDDLARAQEIFLTNSLIGIWPVIRLDRTVEGKSEAAFAPGAVTHRLQETITDD
jgi:4-amino-4-deoxychorismate lyase